MKTPNSLVQTLTPPGIKRVLGMMVVLVLVAFNWCAQAGNVLSNPGFDTLFTGWSAHSTESWSIGSSTALIRTGAGSCWMQGLYLNGNAPPYYNMYAYQTIACAPGSTFTADAWFSQYSQDVNHQGGDNGAGSGLFTSDANGEEDCWVEVLFMDSANNVLADYRSVILTPDFVNNLVNTGATSTNASGTFLNWVDCQVTNIYNPATLLPNQDPATNTAGITGSLGPGQYMVAPAGTAKVQYRLALAQAQYESGASYWDDCSLNLIGGPGPSVIGNVSPDGSKFFNIASGSFTFNVTSAASGNASLPDNPQSGIAITVNGHDQSSSLQFSGASTNLSVTLPNLASNTLYNISISVSNSAGLLTSKTVAFDTFATNNVIINSEDYDYSGGQFIQTPIPSSSANANSYWGRAGTLGTDMNTYNGSGTLPGGAASPMSYPNRSDYNVAFEASTDIQLPLYAAQGDPNVHVVDISYNNGGNWLNYTRNPYPQGNYAVYARISGGAGLGNEYLNLLTSGYGTSTQTTNNLGVFNLANGTDWGHYMWVPLTDAYGNIVAVNLPAGRQTLQLLSGGGENVIDFMFVPFSSAGLPPAIGNLIPNVVSQNAFVNSSNLTFTVTSSSSTVASNNITTSINGSDVSASEKFTGNPTSWSVTVPLPQNKILSVVINAKDANSQSNSVAVTFDTFSQSNFTIEAEDFDFNGGMFIDNPDATGNVGPATNSYFLNPGDPASGQNAGIFDEDLTTPGTDSGEQFAYRPADTCGTETTTDFLRNKFVANGASDYDVGWWDPGTWLNYTRTFPTNNYYVYGRLAGGGPFTGTALSLVTSGRGTTTQTTQALGTFSDQNAAGWQVWHWVPLLDGIGQPVKVSLGGVQTVRSTSGGGLNANFYMFVVASTVPNPVTLTATASGGNIRIAFPTQSQVTYTVLYKNSLSDPAWQTLTTIPGDGTVKTATDSVTGQQTGRFYKVQAQ